MKTVQSNRAQDISHFTNQLNVYKKQIDAHIEKFITDIESQTGEQYGIYPLEAIKTLTDYLRRGGKRIRGALTMVGYHAYGGENVEMIIEAATAVEVLQAFVLMMDDIQDRSETRRGGPTAHIMLKNYHQKQHLKGDSLHFGQSIAMDAFVAGNHIALNLLASLNVKPELKIRALQNVHRTYIATTHGQTVDIFNEVVESVDEADINNVLVWKTAYYTFQNPLQLGAILAGASEKEISVFEDFAIPAGIAFQITDDILGTFGEEFESGKSPMDDIQEGKRTVLTVYALNHAAKADSYFLSECLGKDALTRSEFERCRDIIISSGALKDAQVKAETAVETAVSVLNNLSSCRDTNDISFLRGLIFYLLGRKS